MAQRLRKEFLADARKECKPLLAAYAACSERAGFWTPFKCRQENRCVCCGRGRGRHVHGPLTRGVLLVLRLLRCVVFLLPWARASRSEMNACLAKITTNDNFNVFKERRCAELGWEVPDAPLRKKSSLGV